MTDSLLYQHVFLDSTQTLPVIVPLGFFQREMYRRKLHNTDAVMYVIGKRRYMIEGARGDIHDLFQDESLEGVPVLVVVDKENLHTENIPEEIEDRLKLNKLKGHQWRK